MMYNVLLSLSLLYLLLVVVVLAVGAVATITTTTNSVSSSSSSSSSSSLSSSSTTSTTTTNDNYDSNQYKNNNNNNNNNNVECRSNTTHIAWRSNGQKYQQQHESSYYVTTTAVHQEQQVQQEQRLLDTIVLNEENGNDNDNNEDIVCTWETIEEAYLSAQNYLHRNIFQFDLPFQSTLGFPVDKGTDNDDDDDDVLPDGLGDGIVNGTLVYAFRAKEIFAYTDIIERSIFYEYILPYAFLNEGRTNWRPYLWDHLIEPVLLLQSSSLSSSSSKKANIQQQQQQQQQKDESDQNEDNNNNNLQSIVDKANQLNYTINDVVRILNTHMWNVLAPASAVDTGGIVFKSGQAPTILDPMSVLVFGYGSCTALSILFCCALRTAGIPCRIAGTPAWYQNRSQGNHNWVEIYTNQQWYFIESSPAALAIDTIERNPCHRWFCTKDRYTNNTTTTTKVYSAKLDTTTNTDTFFRLAWEWSNQDIPAIDQTNYYYTICSQC